MRPFMQGSSMENDTPPIELLDPVLCSEWICAGGPLEKLFPGFEERAGQIALLQRICTAFNEDKIAAFEAGTGVGKSFAYLIPAVLWAVKNKERVVVSTGTINLQQQLYEKDIPAAKSLLNSDFNAVLMKGRQNYLCLRRLYDSIDEADLFDEEKEELQTIFKWSHSSETGSNSDLSFMPSASLWQRVNSESDACMGNRCRFYERCFVMKMRKKAAEASVLVVNHHLLFADIEMRASGTGADFEETAVLPPYKRLILDEAHGIENAATGFFSESVNRFSFLKQLHKLHRVRKSAAAGLLYTIEALSASSDGLSEAVNLIQLVQAHIRDMEEAALPLFEHNASAVRLCEASECRFSAFINAMNVLSGDVVSLCDAVRGIIDCIDEDVQADAAVWETKQILRRLEAMGLVCKNFGEWRDRNDTVFWLEKHFLEKGGLYPVCYQTPLNTASMIHANVFEPLSTVVCTSATLTAGGSFGYWLGRTGTAFVEKERLLCDCFPSPFNYKKNLLFSVPADMAEPANPGFQQALEHNLVKLIRASSGRALVLFTSYESLHSACSYVRSMLAPDNIAVYKQGDDDRFRLLERFKKDGSSVLFATDSFWEGVDVPGESLSHVIIVKLPFTVPTDPVFQARCEDLEKKGISSFMQLSLPEAVIHFRQGFGRLIRHSSDRGAVTVLDKRLIEKRYGALFLNSVPETKRLFESVDTLCSSIRRFLDA